MKNYCKCFLAIIIAVTTTLTTQAELVWEKGQGWRIEGGALDPYLGDQVNARNALELMNAARELQEEGAYFRALGAYATVRDKYPLSIYAPEALFQSARIHTIRKQFDEAYEELNMITELYPDYENFNRVIGQQFEIASQLMEGKRPHYWGFIPGLRDEIAAMDYFEGVVQRAPYSRYAPVALMNVALIAKSKGKTEEAIDALDRLITNYPKSVLAPDAYLNLAKTFASLVDGAYYDQNSTKEAISYYRDFLVLYPNDPNIEEVEQGLTAMMDTLARSKYLIGDFYWRYRHNPTAAAIFLNETITIAPDTKSAQQARELLDKIAAGKQASGTPVDWLFGEYQNPGQTTHEETPLTETTAEDIPLQTEPQPETVNPSWN